MLGPADEDSDGNGNVKTDNRTSRVDPYMYGEEFHHTTERVLLSLTATWTSMCMWMKCWQIFWFLPCRAISPNETVFFKRMVLGHIQLESHSSVLQKPTSAYWIGLQCHQICPQLNMFVMNLKEKGLCQTTPTRKRGTAGRCRYRGVECYSIYTAADLWFVYAQKAFFSLFFPLLALLAIKLEHNFNRNMAKTILGYPGGITPGYPRMGQNTLKNTFTSTFNTFNVFLQPWWYVRTLIIYTFWDDNILGH